MIQIVSNIPDMLNLPKYLKHPLMRSILQPLGLSSSPSPENPFTHLFHPSTALSTPQESNRAEQSTEAVTYPIDRATAIPEDVMSFSGHTIALALGISRDLPLLEHQHLPRKRPQKKAKISSRKGFLGMPRLKREV